MGALFADDDEEVRRRLRKEGGFTTLEVSSEEAAKIILAIPPDPDKIAVLDEWWAERRQLAYQALKAGKTKLAYELANEAGPLSVNPLKEQSFMAGWIAWRYLKDAESAYAHFKALEKAERAARRPPQADPPTLLSTVKTGMPPLAFSMRACALSSSCLAHPISPPTSA